jgi:hypothetical protein
MSKLFLEEFLDVILRSEKMFFLFIDNVEDCLRYPHSETKFKFSEWLDQIIDKVPNIRVLLTSRLPVQGTRSSVIVQEIQGFTDK